MGEVKITVPKNPIPPASPNEEIVVYPQFYFTSEEAERKFWADVAAQAARSR